MTWQEFKKEVDKQLEEKGISEDEELWYVDWPGGWEDESVNVSLGEWTGIKIS